MSQRLTRAFGLWRLWFLVSVAISLYANYCTDYHRG